MKRIIIYSVLIVVNLGLGIYGMSNKVLEYPSDKILGYTLYKYNAVNGEYDTLIINKESIKYSGNDFDLSNCKKYTYTEETNIVKMDCGKAFRLISPNDSLVAIGINNENYYFYKYKEDTYLREFNNKYEMTLSDYEFEGNEKLNKIKISKEDFDELFNNQELSFVYVRPNECKNECILFAGVIDKLTVNKKLYYLDYELLDEENLNSIIAIDKDFKESVSPKVLVIENGKIINVIDVSIIGFNTDKLYGLLDDYNGENNNE